MLLNTWNFLSTICLPGVTPEWSFTGFISLSLKWDGQMLWPHSSGMRPFGRAVWELAPSRAILGCSLSRETVSNGFPASPWLASHPFSSPYSTAAAAPHNRATGSGRGQGPLLSPKGQAWPLPPTSLHPQTGCLALPLLLEAEGWGLVPSPPAQPELPAPHQSRTAIPPDAQDDRQDAGLAPRLRVWFDQNKNKRGQYWAISHSLHYLIFSSVTLSLIWIKYH